MIEQFLFNGSTYVLVNNGISNADLLVPQPVSLMLLGSGWHRSHSSPAAGLTMSGTCGTDWGTCHVPR
jgi:hypothetical protein